MEQKNLQKTVETIASQNFKSVEELLIKVLTETVENENINITGGRIWILNIHKSSYKLLYQLGNIDNIDEDFEVKIKDYPIFDLITSERTVLTDETNDILKGKGIIKYSASGIGMKIKVGKNCYYEYLLALNNDRINEKLKYDLSIIAAILTSKLYQQRYSQKADLLKADINKGREIQKSILPANEYNFFEYEMFGLTKPAEIVGGDFFDYLEIGDEKERLAVVLGDAASKGVGAAAEAMYISGALRMASNFEIKIAPLMRKINKQINKIFDDDKIATFFYGELSNDKNGLFLFANAGHNPPIFLKHNSDEIIRLNPTGPVFGPIPNARYNVGNINFAEGDLLVIFSDGITDSANSQFEDYGEERLTDCIIKNRNKKSKEITLSIIEDVVKFSANGKYSDDKTLIVIKRKTPNII